MADEPYGRFQGIYQDAVRRITVGNYESFPVADKRMEIFVCSAERILPRPPWAEWAGHIPSDLPERFAASESFPGQRMPLGQLAGMSVNITIPAFFEARGRLLVPSRNPLGLEPEWQALFPGYALAEAIPFRDSLRDTLALRDVDPETYRFRVDARVRERTERVYCPNQLPYWDLLALEDQEDALTEARGRFHLMHTSWPELRASDAFLKATSEPMEVTVVKGWQGVIWLQLASRLSPNRCQWPGCLEPVGFGLEEILRRRASVAGQARSQQESD